MRVHPDLPSEGEQTANTSIWFVSWGDKPLPRNRRERWVLKLRIYRWRLRDAWLVLQGKADID